MVAGPAQAAHLGRPWTAIVGVDLINLATFITTWPEATIDEMAVFIY
jgi:hypothetical protein